MRAGRRSGRYYTNRYTNAARTPLFAATNAAFVIVNLYSRPPEVVVAFAAQPGLAQPKSASLSPHM
jgi:hypothetical protein